MLQKVSVAWSFNVPDRPSDNPKQFIQGAPVLHVKDPQASAEFYRDKLGFNFDFAMEGYSIVWRDNAAIHFSQGPVEVAGMAIFQWVVDVDAYYAELKSRSVVIERDIADQPYDVREFSVIDLNGISVVFGQDLE
ncbi:MAG: glyoxalase superfamily protein [Pseudomonadales bacterium]|nr:glyoxalase superfamily protein [Pseudomonadales bacterium]